jgi:Ca2+:H+ antiporter
LTPVDLARVVDTARRAAAAANHAFVGTEHLLAATLTEADGDAARALSAAGVSQDGLAEELLAGLPAAQSGAPGPPPMSRFAERAVQEAEREGGRLVAILLRAPKGRIASVLARRGANQEELRNALAPARPARPAQPPRAPPPEPSRARPARPPTPSRTPPALAPAAPEQAATERRLPPHLEPKPGRTGLGRIPWSLILLLGIPVSLVLRWQQGSPLLIFIAACLAMLPLAGVMGEATEQLAERSGPTVGGLLNATFGNAAELIIALVALRAGMVDLVKASITGSILGNLLLILGLSLLAGGLQSPLLKFNRTSAGMSAAMLALATAGLAFPALFHFVHPGTATARLALTELQLSEAVAIILALTYAASLVFSLRTHRALFGVDPAATPQGPTWSAPRAIGLLALATGGVVVESELLVGSVEPVTHALGISQTFLGLILIPVIGNAAEHATAITVARKGKLDLSLQIALGSSTQVALLIAPLLVLAGVLLGQPLSLLFTPLEVVALGISTVVVSIITLDGESHWFEGVQLLALYAMVAAAAYFL